MRLHFTPVKHQNRLNLIRMSGSTTTPRDPTIDLKLQINLKMFVVPHKDRDKIQLLPKINAMCQIPNIAFQIPDKCCPAATRSHLLLLNIRKRNHIKPLDSNAAQSFCCMKITQEL